ncbi:MAG: hypothetical protein DI527_16515 [Chelatococcus sp.]|nr:MAG: hypothetical protein DI527_16515 [Chelatococcus sp.]
MPKQDEAKVTYYVVQSFSKAKRGVEVDPAVEMRSEQQARRTAERLAATKVGVVAFSRTGSPSSGEWEPAVILAQYGAVSDELIEFLSAA